MTLQDQVSSLELSQKLKALGVKQDGLFIWTENVIGSWNVELEKEAVLPVHPSSFCSALTVAELGEMLPMEPKSPGNYFETTRVAFNNWIVTYSEQGNNSTLAFAMGDTEADARAAMLIYLIENSLLTI